jgi:hypothetical protein
MSPPPGMHQPQAVEKRSDSLLSLLARLARREVRGFLFPLFFSLQPKADEGRRAPARLPPHFMARVAWQRYVFD